MWIEFPILIQMLEVLILSSFQNLKGLNFPKFNGSEMLKVLENDKNKSKILKFWDARITYFNIQITEHK